MARLKLDSNGLRFLTIATSIFITGFIAPNAHARTFRIFEVRKNLQLNDDEPVIHDYYLNAGTSQGLRQGMTIPVNRKEVVHDFYGDNEDDLVITVGRLKLISVQENISIGRIFIPRNSRQPANLAPILDFATIMIGDRVDLAGASDGDDIGTIGVGTGTNGNGKGSNGSIAGAGIGDSGTLNPVPVAAPEATTVQAPTKTIPKTAPKITMEPMGPATTAKPKRAAANDVGSLPKLELRSPDDFKNVNEQSGSLNLDDTAPEVNVR
jgi:hypothetical protein